MAAAANELTASQAARAIAEGTLTSEALVRACLDRIAAREPTVQAWEHVDPDQAIAEARRRDSEAPRGPLHGVPVGIKDIIETADMPTGFGSPIYAGHRPAADAACVARVRRAGGVILGKTVTTEFAVFRPGKTRNPHNPAHTPGGSSSGSAAAVADAMVPLAFGTQTAASVIRPGSYCGTVAYKASHLEMSLAGVKLLGQSLDSLGIFARSVADCALMRAGLLGAPAAPAILDTPPRIGLCRTPQWPQADAASRDAVEAAAARLAGAGAHVTEVRLPDAFDALVDRQNDVMCYETARSLAWEYEAQAERLSDRLLAIIEAGNALDYAAYRAALAARDRAIALLADIFAGVDVLLAPSAQGEAPAGLDATGNPLFSRMWTLLRVPSVSLPGHRGPSGLPVGVQAIGPHGHDDRLLAVAAWMERRIA